MSAPPSQSASPRVAAVIVAAGQGQRAGQPLPKQFAMWRGKQVVRHSAAHLMAQAVQELWPDVKVTIGPVIENGFYYDFDKKEPFSDEDLKAIKKQMQKIINKNPALVEETWSRAKASSTNLL